MACYRVCAALVIILGLSAGGLCLSAESSDGRGGGARLEVVPAEPGGIFPIGTPAVLQLTMKHADVGQEVVRIGLEVRDALGDRLEACPREVILRRSEGFAASFELPARVGFYEIRCPLMAGGGMRVAVIPNNAISRKRPDSPFGVNTHFNQGNPSELGAVVRKAGIAWIRDGEATLDDRAVQVAKANHLCYMPCFTWYRKPLATDRNAQGQWDFSAIAERHRQYAEKYRADVDAYDLVNEPEGPWREVLPGSYVGGEWLEVFVQYGRQVTAALKAGDPNAKVLWEDSDLMTHYRWFQRLGAAEMIYAISPHPYCGERTRPLPEEQITLEFLDGFHRFVAEHKLKWRLWSGEAGFSTFRLDQNTPVDYYTPQTELQQAQHLVRMMVLQFARGVDKVFWYEIADSGVNSSDPEHHFGLLRKDGTPKPSLVAYSVLIDMLGRAGGAFGRWLGRYPLDGGTEAYVYRTAGGAPVMMAWMRRGSVSEDLPVFSGVREVRVTDIFGSSRGVAVKGGRVDLLFTETPVFIEGLKDEDVIPYLAWRTP